MTQHIAIFWPPTLILILLEIVLVFFLKHLIQNILLTTRFQTLIQKIMLHFTKEYWITEVNYTDEYTNGLTFTFPINNGAPLVTKIGKVLIIGKKRS